MIIEIGNTRCKFLDGSIIYYSSYENLTFLQFRLSQLTKHKKIYYSSVNSTKLEVIKQLLPESKDNFVNVHNFITSQCIRNFNECTHIGADRLFGVLGAKKHAKNAIISVDCGTATTINYYTKQSEFKGGMIFPGYMTQKYSILSKTGIQLQSNQSQNNKLSLLTSDAIHYGIISNTCGAILLAVQEITQIESQSPTVVITGGNYHYFFNKLNTMNIIHKFDPFLVLRGMVSVLPEEVQKEYFVKW